MAEVSTQDSAENEPVEETPQETPPETSEVAEQAPPQETPEQDTPPQEVQPQEIPEQGGVVADKTEAPPDPTDPREVQELDKILTEIKHLANVCEDVLKETADLKHQEKVQARLNNYAHALAHLPKSLQLLHDFRRHLRPLHKHAEALQKELIKFRGGEDDAVSSEEVRVILASIGSRDTVLASIGSLEGALSMVRQSTPELLTVIGHEGSDFKDYATFALRNIRVDLVSDILHTEYNRLFALQSDICLLYELDSHVQELANVQAAA